MSDIIDLNERRNAMSAPDSDCVYIDIENGKPVKYFKFSASYAFDGKEWSVHIWATDEDQAKAKIAALGNATYDGQIFAEIPA